MKSAIRRRPGWSLLELLVVMMLITLLIGVIAMLMREALTTEQIQAGTYQRVQEGKALADQFRADVAAAETAPANWQNHVAGPDTLILQMKDQVHLVYSWRDGALRRLTISGKDQNTRHLPVPGNTKIEFDRSPPDGNLVRVRLLTVRLGKAVPGQTLEFAAAVGGDWR